MAAKKKTTTRSAGRPRLPAAERAAETYPLNFRVDGPMLEAIHELMEKERPKHMGKLERSDVIRAALMAFLASHGIEVKAAR
jgi:hypothetical protein